MADAPGDRGEVAPDDRSVDDPDAHRVSLAFEYPGASGAAVVERAIREEVDDLADDRARATVDRDGAILRVEVTAADLVALRAGANTWLGLVETAEDAAAVAGGR